MTNLIFLNNCKNLIYYEKTFLLPVATWNYAERLR